MSDNNGIDQRVLIALNLSNENKEIVQQLEWLRDYLERLAYRTSNLVHFLTPKPSFSSIRVTFKHGSPHKALKAKQFVRSLLMATVFEHPYLRAFFTDKVFDNLYPNLAAAELVFGVEGAAKVFSLPLTLSSFAATLPPGVIATELNKAAVKLNDHLQKTYTVFELPKLTALEHRQYQGTLTLLNSVTGLDLPFEKFKQNLAFMKKVMGQVSNYQRQWFDDYFYFFEKFISAYEITPTSMTAHMFALQTCESINPGTRFSQVYRVFNRTFGQILAWLIAINDQKDPSLMWIDDLVKGAEEMIDKRLRLNQKYNN